MSGFRSSSNVGPHGFGLGARRKGRRQRVKLRAYTLIERLEDRVLLSTYVVTNNLDSGPGSLRDDIKTSNAAGGVNTITFAPGLTGTITLTSGQLEISNDLTIAGPGAASLTISGNNQSRVFLIDAGVTASISGITITGGRAPDGTASLSPGGNGGGIYSLGTLALSGDVIRDNTGGTGAPGLKGGDGGGIYAASLTASYCTVDSNSAGTGGASSGRSGDAGNGGAIFCGSAVITDSTIINNRAGVPGNVLFPPGVAGYPGTGGGIFSFDLTLINSTLSGNSPVYGDGGAIRSNGLLRLTNDTVSGNDGPGLFVEQGDAILNNTIVAPDSVEGRLDPAGAHNLIGDGSKMTGLSSGDGNQIGYPGYLLDPRLAPLGNYGGPTQTMALRTGSPAIDAGSNALAVGPDGKPLLTDQRGYYRIFNGTVDIGAYEFGASPLLPGDADADGKVDFADLVLVARHYGMTNATWADGDFNNDGSVGFDDLVIVARNYGKTIGGANAAAPLSPAVVGQLPKHVRAHHRPTLPS